MRQNVDFAGDFCGEELRLHLDLNCCIHHFVVVELVIIPDNDGVHVALRLVLKHGLELLVVDFTLIVNR